MFMDIINIIWELGIFSIIIMFGIKISLASGLSNIPKKYIALIIVGYSGWILILSQIASIYATKVASILYNYGSVLFLIMSRIWFV